MFYHIYMYIHTLFTRLCSPMHVTSPANLKHIDLMAWLMHIDESTSQEAYCPEKQNVEYVEQQNGHYTRKE
jgi:hypothetical protein